jgi:hypothetical protein
MKADRLVTLSRCFTDPKSYVTADGREVLYRKDWTARKEELRQRSAGRCEKITSDGRRCRSAAVHPHHFPVRRRTKGSNTRDDRMTNLLDICALHHALDHPEKQPQWTVK